MTTLSEKQKKLLEGLGDILTYGSQRLSQVEMNATKIRPKKYIVFSTITGAQSYSEAILKLMKPENIYDKAASVLLRSLIEAFINLNYVFSSQTNRNAMLFVVESEKDRIAFAEKHAALWRKYPTWKLKFGTIEKADDWDKFIQSKQKLIQKIEKKYKISLNQLPNLLDRGIAFDTQYKKSKKLPKDVVIRRLERRSLEKYYVLFYKYFSQIAHLTMPGLEQFLRVDQNGNWLLDVDGKPLDIETVIPVTYIIYMAILAHFLKQFKIYDKTEFQKFKDLAKIFSK